MPSGLSKSYMVLPAVGLVTLPKLPQWLGRFIQQEPAPKCYRNYTWLPSVNASLREAIEESRTEVVDMLAIAERDGNPSEVIHALGGTGIPELDVKEIEATMPRDFVRDLLSEMRHRIADGQTVQFAWEDHDTWHLRWADDIPPESRMAVAVVYGPSPF
jgi:hypothetical protein